MEPHGKTVHCSSLCETVHGSVSQLESVRFEACMSNFVALRLEHEKGLFANQNSPVPSLAHIFKHATTSHLP